MVLFSELDAWLGGHPTAVRTHKQDLVDLLSTFVQENEDPNRSANYKYPPCDPLANALRVLKDPAVESDETLTLLVLKTFKILSRKHDNRMALGEAGVAALVRYLHKPRNARIAAEGANVVLNVCYEKENVDSVLKCNAVVPLVSFLTSKDADLQANAAGAIQSISFQDKGRLSVRDIGAIPDILSLLHSDNLKVRTRAVGAIHNMSSDADTIRIIRRKDGIPPLVTLLSAPQPTVSGSAAGALQNVSREVASRVLIRDLNAIPPLTDLLFGSDLQAQVCAAGALLNILGPELAGEDNSHEHVRKAFARLVSLSLSLSMAYATLFPGKPVPKPEMV
eukprot:jgi/Mesvir1/25126/Mv21584-RA.1